MLSEREMVGNSKQEDARSEPGKTGKEGTEKEQSKPNKKQEDARSVSGMTTKAETEDARSIKAGHDRKLKLGRRPERNQA